MLFFFATTPIIQAADTAATAHSMLGIGAGVVLPACTNSGQAHTNGEGQTRPGEKR